MDNQTHEIMSILQEECAEVIQAVSKCFRFGADQCKPGKDYTNVQHLEEEIGDLLAMVDILVEKKILTEDRLKTAKAAKQIKLQTWSNIYK